MGSEQIPILFLGAAVYAHHGLFGVDLALQKPISHTEKKRWALRLMEHDITLKWRPWTQHQLPDAMSRLPDKSNVIEDFDDSFPGDESLPNAVSYTHLTLPTICSV